uniref:(northern house mosquito) hypothetical protein n=1 Tax=Culex pipiens TaxID=7175 RepID=A0A8D8E5L4_CULPI
MPVKGAVVTRTRDFWPRVLLCIGTKLCRPGVNVNSSGRVLCALIKKWLPLTRVCVRVRIFSTLISIQLIVCLFLCRFVHQGFFSPRFLCPSHLFMSLATCQL